MQKEEIIMVNEKFRKAFDAYVDENEIQETYGDALILGNPAYDNSIVGITEDGILIYDFNKMIEEFVEDEGCTVEEAVEWLEHNTMRALPYMGERHPIVLVETSSSLIDKYGE